MQVVSTLLLSPSPGPETGKWFNLPTALRVSRLRMGTTRPWATWPSTLPARTRTWPLAAKCHTMAAIRSWISNSISPVSSTKTTMTHHSFLLWCRTRKATCFNLIKPMINLHFFHVSPQISLLSDSLSCPRAPTTFLSLFTATWRVSTQRKCPCPGFKMTQSSPSPPRLSRAQTGPTEPDATTLWAPSRGSRVGRWSVPWTNPGSWTRSVAQRS